MDDEVTLLSDCAAVLPISQIVDRVPFYRIVSLQISEGGGPPQNAIYPADHAVPAFVREGRLHGWPPEKVKLPEVRRGLALMDLWRDPPEESRIAPAAVVEVGDVDTVIATRKVQIEGREQAVKFDRAQIEALLMTGTTVVYLEGVQKPVVVRSTAPARLEAPAADVVHVSDPHALLAASDLMVGGRRFSITRDAVRQLRLQGTAILHSEDDGGEQSTVRVVVGDTTSSVGVTVSAATSAPTTRGGMVVATRTVAFAANAVAAMREASLPDDPLPDFPFAIYLPYRQEWKLLGFSRGDLLNTIALAPQEETTIEVSTWDRQRWSSEDTTEMMREDSLEAGWMSRLSREVVRDLTMSESSRLTSAGVQIPTPSGMSVGVNLGGDFGGSLNEVNKSTTSWLSEATAKAAMRTRGMRQTKVTQGREWGIEQKTTRRLRNANLARTLAYDFFEVLAKYEVSVNTVADEMRLVVLIPNPMPIIFDRATLIAREGVLRRALLDDSQIAGFDAARWLAAREEYCAIPLEPGCGGSDDGVAPAPVTSVGGNAPASPPTSPAGGGDIHRVQVTGDRLAEAIRKIRDATHRVYSMHKSGLRGAALDPYVLEYRQWMLRVFALEPLRPGFWGALKRFESEWDNQRDPQRLEQVLDETAAAWVEAVGRIALGVILYQITGPIAVVALVAHLGTKTLWYAPYTLQGFDDAGLGALLSAARTEVSSWRRSLAPPAAEAPPPAASLPSPGATESPTSVNSAAGGESAFSRDETARRRIAERGLLSHIEQNQTYYLEAIWRSIPSADQMRILDGAFDRLGRDLEPQVLGFYGDRLAVPFRVDRYPQLRAAFQAAADQIRADPAATRTSLVLPTPGIQIEARLGACDAAEPFVAEQRTLELRERERRIERLTAEARQAEHEAGRLEARLAAEPPLLDRDAGTVPAITVRVVTDGGTPDTPS